MIKEVITVPTPGLVARHKLNSDLINSDNALVEEGRKR